MIAAALVAAALGLSSTAVEAAPVRRSVELGNAIESIAERDYEQARLYLAAALVAGRHAHADTVLIYRLSGEVAAAYGRRAEAQRFFQRMLAVEPDAEVAVSQLPNAVQPYDGARAYFAGARAPIGVAYDFEPETHVITMRVVSDPFDMVAGVRLSYGEGARAGVREQPYQGGDVPVVVPDDLERRAWVTVVDQYGNELRPREVVLPPTAGVQAPVGDALLSATPESLTDGAADSDRRSSRSIIGRWYVWGVLTLGAGGTAAFFGSRADRDWQQLDTVIADSGKYDYREAEALERGGQRKALIANIALGTAVTTASIAAFLLVRELRSGSKRHESSSRLGAIPVTGGAAVTWGIGF